MSTKQFIQAIIVGVVFWFMGAMTVKTLGSDVLSPGNPLLILAFIAIYPITYILFLPTLRLLGIPRSLVVEFIAIGTFAATAMDGIALTWFMSLYANDYTTALHGAAYILWGGAAGLIIAYLMQKFGLGLK